MGLSEVGLSEARLLQEGAEYECELKCSSKAQAVCSPPPMMLAHCEHIAHLTATEPTLSTNKGTGMLTECAAGHTN